MIRCILFFLAIMAAFQLNAQSLEELNEKMDAFLKANTQKGLVNYKGIRDAPEVLFSITKEIEQVVLEDNPSTSEKAFLINAYNLLVIRQVADHYPIPSPQDVHGFFTEKKFKIDDRVVSLNQLEKDIIFTRYPDSRLHFALVCAARGCPKLRPEAYRENALEFQLEDQTQQTLQDTSFASYEGQTNTWNTSKIFDWYAGDFGDNRREIIRFVNTHSDLMIPGDARISYKEYDWALNDKKGSWKEQEEKSNLELFTPSALFNKGEFEINVFNSIYSQQEIRGANGETIELPNTENFFTSWMTFMTGLSEQSRLNLGFDLFIHKARFTPGDHSAFEVFHADDEALFNRTVVSYFAPKIKFVPIRKIPRLSVQSALWIPLRDDLESEGFIAHQRYTWFTQVFFDQYIGRDFQIFLEADLLYRFASVASQRYDFFRTPVSTFLSWFPTSKSTLFAFGQYSPRFENSTVMAMAPNGTTSEEFGLTQWFVQLGVGGKYQITEALGMEISYSDFSFARQEGAGHTVNLGLRYIYR
ncbi:MAG TPA: DUF547 domain-containing protein [Saprospiraceae bacterium]|nr:DUF547 domain-containing protein [Saprospiraceae bacterium]